MRDQFPSAWPLFSNHDRMPRLTREWITRDRQATHMPHMSSGELSNAATRGAVAQERGNAAGDFVTDRHRHVASIWRIIESPGG
jgi:hypothetical protein